MKPGDLVKIKCSNNRYLNGKVGTLLLTEDRDGPIYGTCVMIDGAVYGFEEHEVEKIILSQQTGADSPQS